jgi:transcriptional regulator with XRE-family HTH domain
VKIRFIGEKMRVAREEQGLSLDDLKELTGISKAYLSQLEIGKRKDPSLENINKIAEALRLPPVYFVLDNAFLFTQLLPDEYRQQPELMNFLLSGKSLPWVTLAKDAKLADIDPEVLEVLIRTLHKRNSK